MSAPEIPLNDDDMRRINKMLRDAALSKLEPVTDETLPDWKPFVCQHLEPYDWHGPRGFTSIYVLQFLWGKPMSRIAMGYIHALRPSCLRIVESCETSDAILWRVTVHLEDDKITIRNIEQEVEIAGGAGAKLEQAFHEAIDKETLT